VISKATLFLQTSDFRRSRRFLGSWHSANQYTVSERSAHPRLW